MEKGNRVASWVELSSIDTGILMMGVLFQEIITTEIPKRKRKSGQLAGKLLNGMDWSIFHMGPTSQTTQYNLLWHGTLKRGWPIGDGTDIPKVCFCMCWLPNRRLKTWKSLWRLVENLRMENSFTLDFRMWRFLHFSDTNSLKFLLMFADLPTNIWRKRD